MSAECLFPGAPNAYTLLDDLDFKLILAYPRGGETIHLRATSARDAQNWIKSIEEAREKSIHAERRSSTYIPTY